MKRKHYEVQTIPNDGGEVSYRITHIMTDSRVATCWSPHNANLVCDALNAYNQEEVSTWTCPNCEQHIAGSFGALSQHVGDCPGVNR